MAPRKSPAAAAAWNPDAVHPQTKPERRKSPNPADSAAAAVEKKLTNLKTLNEFLLKQILELRVKEKRATDASLFSAYEREIAFVVLSARLADEKTSLERQASMEEKLKDMAVEKAEIKKAFELVLSDRDRKAKEVATMKAADAEKISSLVEELRAVSLERDCLEVELIDSKKSLKSVEDERAVLLDELKRAHVDFDLLKKEKEAAEQSTILKMKDLAKLIDELEQERSEQGLVIASKVEELGCIELARDQLEVELRSYKCGFDSVKEELEVGRAEVVDELERVRIDFHVLKNEKEKSEETFVAQMDKLKREKAELGPVISAQVDAVQNHALAKDLLQAIFDSIVEELKQGRARALRELKSTSVDFGILKHEKEQSKLRFKSQMKDLVGQLDAMERERDEQNIVFSAQVEEIEYLTLARDRMEAELRSSEDAFNWMKEERDEGHIRVLGVLRRLQADFDVLKKEKEQFEQSLKLQIEDLVGQVDVITRERAQQELMISTQVEKIQSLALGRYRLEEELRSTEDAFLSMKQELEQGHEKAMDELKIENEQSEQLFKLEMKESAKEFDALTTELSELATQKDTMVQEREERQVKIAGLEIDQQQFKSKVSHAQGELNTEGGKSVVLKLDVFELDKWTSHTEEELELVKTEHDIARAKKNRRFLTWFISAATAATAVLAAGLTTYCAKQRTLRTSSYNR